MDRLFLDTNVVLDYLAARSPFSALLYGNITHIITRNQKHYLSSSITVLSPTDYLSSILK
jgi:hypothetical protein